MPSHFPPGNFWMTGLQVLREVPARLGNNPDAALDEPHCRCQSVSKHREVYPPTRKNALIASMTSVRRGMSERAATRTRVRQFLQFCCRKVLCRLSRVMMSALRPRILAAYSFTSISSKRPSLPFS